MQIGLRGLSVHLGHRTRLVAADATPLYRPACGTTGQRDSTGWKLSVGRPSDQRVTCRRCLHLYPDEVDALHRDPREAAAPSRPQRKDPT